MECSVHPEKTSVGYCKKCGMLGCDECIIRVAMTGQVGKKLDVTEVLLCRECLAKARPDLVVPEAGEGGAPRVRPFGAPGIPRATGTPKKYRDPPKAVRSARAGVRVGKTLTIALALAAVVGAIAAAAIFFPRSKSSPRLETIIPPEEVAALALGALSDGDVEGFLSRVDVAEFMCRMDETGLTRRDYAEADRKKWEELVVFHSGFLVETLFIPANMKEHVPVDLEIGDRTASIRVKPWIAYGRKSYRRIVLERKMGEWRISGLASPDF